MFDNKLIKCSCGHEEHGDEIHTVGSWDKKELFDLCGSCFYYASIIEDKDSSFATWFFHDKRVQEHFVGGEIEPVYPIEYWYQKYYELSHERYLMGQVYTKFIDYNETIKKRNELTKAIEEASDKIQSLINETVNS